MILLPYWLLANIGLLILVAVILLLAGKRLPRQGDWLAFTVLATLLISLGLFWSGYLGSEQETTGGVGWIFRTEEAGALRLGISADALALVLLFVSALTAVVLLALILPGIASLHPTPHVLASVILTIAGSAVCYMATTPWLFAFGISLSMVGGAFTFRWHLAKGSPGTDAERFLRERLWSMLLVVAGVAAWASQGIEVRAGAGGALDSPTGVIALGAIYLGVIIQCQALPFVGIHLEGLESSPSLRFFTTQLLPMWASFALLLRFYDDFTPIGIQPVAGWLGLALAIASTATGLVQREWRSGVPILGSTVALLTFASLNLLGPGVAFCIMVAGGLGLQTLLLTAELTEGSAANPNSALRVPAFLAGVAVSGGVGMASATGLASWAQAYIDIPGAFASILIACGALSVQVWRTVWLVVRSQGITTMTWWKLTLLVLLSFGSLSLVWTGVPVQGVTESAGWSLVPVALPTLSAESGLQALAILQGLLVVGFGLGAWVTPVKGDRVQSLWQRFPRFTGFLAGGFGFDRLFQMALMGTLQAGRMLDRGAHQKLWGEWLPRTFAFSIRLVARPSLVVDGRIQRTIDRSALSSADFPGRLVQLIQSGDVQWYLFFAIACAFALLVHFLVKL